MAGYMYRTIKASHRCEPVLYEGGAKILLYIYSNKGRFLAPPTFVKSWFTTVRCFDRPIHVARHSRMVTLVAYIDLDSGLFCTPSMLQSRALAYGVIWIRTSLTLIVHRGNGLSQLVLTRLQYLKPSFLKTRACSKLPGYSSGVAYGPAHRHFGKPCIIAVTCHHMLCFVSVVWRVWYLLERLGQVYCQCSRFITVAV
jgi:hypothetical protein